MEINKSQLSLKSNLKHLLYVFILSIGLFLLSIVNGAPVKVADFLITFYYTIFCWFGSTFITALCLHIFKTIEQTIWRVITDISIVVVYIFGVVWVSHQLFENYQLNDFWTDYFTCLGITMFISVIFVAQDYFILYKEKVKESEHLKRAQIENELKILSNQVNPHFLFNSLNTLMAIIPENARKALDFTESFSKVYRYALQKQNVETVSIREEIELFRDYCFLLKIRFGENFKCNIEIPENFLSAVIPPFVLQLLVENATKHNTISDSLPLEVSIYPEGEYLVVRNNINEKMTESEGTNTGLINIEKRIKFLTNKSIDVEKGADHFTVKVPIIFIEDYAGSNH